MDEVLQRIERQQREQIERTRAFLRMQGRPDLVEELDANLRDVRLGVSHARGTWHALSKPQRATLEAANKRPALIKLWGNSAQYGYRDRAGRGTVICQLRTLLPLCARGLLASDNVMPVPHELRITEHGRFVLKHGQSQKGC